MKKVIVALALLGSVAAVFAITQKKATKQSPEKKTEKKCTYRSNCMSRM
ncbi:MAG: hypothetical protein SFU87_00120 [Chitinophagaceae bacterium]|nr:hypothetical protein [Chitinophagaceae bacterium]